MKSRKFSIYLLKHGFDARNSLKNDHKLGEPLSDVDNLPQGAVLYVAAKREADPWWKSYWGIKRDLKQVWSGAMVFMPINGRYVALTFGNTYHNLKSEAYEYDFGLRATLNAIDPDKIRATDILQPANAKRERIQSPDAASMTFFDINCDESVVKRLAGAVRSEHHEYFRYVTGASNIRVSSRIEASGIRNMCSKLLEIYDREDYKRDFPDMQSIMPVNGPSEISQLNTQLLGAFREESDNLVLTIPEMLDNDHFHITYSGAHGPRKTYDDVHISHYWEYLNSRDIDEVQLAHLQHHRLNIKDENGETIRSYSVYQCLLYDCEYEGCHYHLCDGNWYRIERNYIQKLKNALDPLFVSHSVLRECDQRYEDEYNRFVADANPGYTCLDGENISLEAQTPVEPCDLYVVTNNTANMIHIKISTRSALLSHLFNQGTNSVELLRLNVEARGKLKELVQVEQRIPIDNNRFAVTYGIITAKDAAFKSDVLPIFSRISLRRAAQSLRLMDINCHVVLIKDNVVRKLQV